MRHGLGGGGGLLPIKFFFFKIEHQTSISWDVAELVKIKNEEHLFTVITIMAVKIFASSKLSPLF
jgi:hypothetical protein